MVTLATDNPYAKPFTWTAAAGLGALAGFGALTFAAKFGPAHLAKIGSPNWITCSAVGASGALLFQGTLVEIQRQREAKATPTPAPVPTSAEAPVGAPVTAPVAASTEGSTESSEEASDAAPAEGVAEVKDLLEAYQWVAEATAAVSDEPQSLLELGYAFTAYNAARDAAPEWATATTEASLKLLEEKKQAARLPQLYKAYQEASQAFAEEGGDELEAAMNKAEEAFDKVKEAAGPELLASVERCYDLELVVRLEELEQRSLEIEDQIEVARDGVTDIETVKAVVLGQLEGTLGRAKGAKEDYLEERTPEENGVEGAQAAFNEAEAALTLAQADLKEAQLRDQVEEATDLEVANEALAKLGIKAAFHLGEAKADVAHIDIDTGAAATANGEAQEAFEEAQGVLAKANDAAVAIEAYEAETAEQVVVLDAAIVTAQTALEEAVVAQEGLVEAAAAKIAPLEKKLEAVEALEERIREAAGTQYEDLWSQLQDALEAVEVAVEESHEVSVDLNETGAGDSSFICRERSHRRKEQLARAIATIQSLKTGIATLAQALDVDTDSNIGEINVAAEALLTRVADLEKALAAQEKAAKATKAKCDELAGFVDALAIEAGLIKKAGENYRVGALAGLVTITVPS